ncbi:MAG: hypothetical protein ABIL09_12810 [Gemmatimonadota bacterium]
MTRQRHTSSPPPAPPPRPDRLIRLPRFDFDCRVQFSVDSGTTWTPATVYLGATVDDWRASQVDQWNRACREGSLPARTPHALWNCFFDVELPAPSPQLRALRADTGEQAWRGDAETASLHDVTVIDYRRFAGSEGALGPGWALRDAGLASVSRPSLFRHLPREKRYLQGSDQYYRWVVDEDEPEPLRICPQAAGWHRVYVGMEPYSTLSLSFGEDCPAYEVPNPYVDSGENDRFLQEFFIAEVDLADRPMLVRPGGSRFWRDVSIRYVKLVPMSSAEVDRHRAVRAAAQRGREFAGYLEPCTVAAYWPRFLRLRDHIRNEMRLNAIRGSTDVYVHLIRIGCKAWYHSALVEWDRSEPHHADWMSEADPGEVAVQEARAAGLKVFLDAGMNSTYVGADAHYAAYTSQFAREHPEYLCPTRPGLFDYRLKAVQEYVVSIVAELMSRYDVDGVSLDFARWGHPVAYDPASLIEVLRRIDSCRRDLERSRGRRIGISVRVPYEEVGAAGTGAAPFAGAARPWARDGLVERFMVELQHEQLFQDKPLEHYRAALAGTRTRLWGDMYWGSWYYGGGPQRDLAIARSLVQRGVDGGFYYYMRGRPIEWESINWQLRLIDAPGTVVAPYGEP